MRWYYDVAARVYEPIRGDAAQYYAYARNLIDHHVFSKASPGAQVVAPDSFRDPGYPVFLAAFIKLFGGNENNWYAAVLLLQGMLGALTTVLTAALARRWLSVPAALATGILAAVWPHSVTVSGLLLTETVFGFLVLLAIWLLAKALDARRQWTLVLSSLVLAAASMVNSVFLPFSVVIAAWLIWRRKTSRRLALILIAGSIAFPAGWQVRNLLIPDGSSARERAEINLVQGSWPEYGAAYRGAILHHDPGDRETLDRIEREQALIAESPSAWLGVLASRFAAAPWKYVAWYTMYKPALLWGWQIQIGQGDIYVYPTVNSPFEVNPGWRMVRALCQALNPWLFAAAILGTIILFRIGSGPIPEGRSIAPELAACVLVYATAVYEVFQAEPRYSIPFRPYEFCAAVTAVCWLRGQVRQLRAAAHASRAAASDAPRTR